MTPPDPPRPEGEVPTRRPTGAIPAHWTVPAEVSASAVERPRSRSPESERGNVGRSLGIFVALLAVLTVALFVTGVVPVPAFALRGEVVPIPDEPVVKGSLPGAQGAEPTGATRVAAATPGEPSGPPTAPAADPPALVSPSDAPAPDPTLAADDGGEGAVDDLEPSTAEPSTAEPSTAEPSTAEPRTAEPRTAEPRTAEPGTAEPASPSEQPMVLDELPVRRKVKGLIERGEGLIRKGKHRSAARILEKAAKLDPNFPRAQRSLGIARARLGDFAGARKAYERYLELDPTASDAADVRRILGQ